MVKSFSFPRDLDLYLAISLNTKYSSGFIFDTFAVLMS